MASYIAHYIIGKKILEYFHYNYDDFMLGNLLPDTHDGTQNGYDNAHFLYKINSEIKKSIILEVFKNKYSNYFNKSLILGYYCHLMSDYVWRQQEIPGRPKNIASDSNSEEAKLYRKKIYEDYARLNKILTKHYKLSTPDKLNIPDSIIVTEINKQNISTLLNNLSSQFENKIEGELDLITLDFMVNYIDNAVKFCVENLRHE
jgi:hypothetical protein